MSTSGNTFVFLWLGGASGLIALAVSVLFVSTPRRYGLVILAGLLLALGWFAFAFLGASTDPSHHPDCSDCSYIWGRWWEPPLVVAVVALNFLGWLVGASLGWLIRRASTGPTNA